MGHDGEPIVIHTIYVRNIGRVWRAEARELDVVRLASDRLGAVWRLVERIELASPRFRLADSVGIDTLPAIDVRI
jgi:hypothetical protein